MASVLSFIVFCFFITLTETQSVIPRFSEGIAQGNIDSPEINDASGLAASQKFPGILYTHNDHGDRPRLFAINATDARMVAVLEISPAYNNDWEDIAVGPCARGDNRSCIYISDDGEYHERDEKTVYRVVEPDFMTHQLLSPNGRLKFDWSEHGSKTLMVDPDANVYIVSAVLGGRGMIVKLPNDAWNQPIPVNVDTGYFLGIESPYNDPNAGDISPDGSEVIIKTMKEFFLWSVEDDNYLQNLTSKGVKLPLTINNGGTTDYGQGVCFSVDGTAIYSLAEGLNQPLYKYTKL